MSDQIELFDPLWQTIKANGILLQITAAAAMRDAHGLQNNTSR